MFNIAINFINMLQENLHEKNIVNILYISNYMIQSNIHNQYHSTKIIPLCNQEKIDYYNMDILSPCLVVESEIKVSSPFTKLSQKELSNQTERLDSQSECEASTSKPVIVKKTNLEITEKENKINSSSKESDIKSPVLSLRQKDFDVIERGKKKYNK